MEVILNPIVIIVFVMLIILLFVRDQKIASLKLENFNIRLINDQLTGQVVDLKQQIKEHTLSGEIYNEMADPRTRINLGQQTEPDELALEEQHPGTAPTRLPTAEELRVMPVARVLQGRRLPSGSVGMAFQDKDAWQRQLDGAFEFFSDTEHNRTPSVEEIEASVDGDNECRCNVGVQECWLHPGRLYTEEQKKQFGLSFNLRVAAAEGK